MANARAIFLSGSAVGVMACAIACIPHPAADFEDYKERTIPFATPTGGDAGQFDGSTVTEPTEGLYYGACLSQLAFGAPNKVFNFYTKTKFTPGAAGADGKLTITLQALKLKVDGTGAPVSPAAPPEKFDPSGRLDPLQTSKEVPVAGTKVSIGFNDVAGRPGLVVVPGLANPITGRDVEIENVKLTGIFAKEKFCALLNGTVVKPVNLELEPPKNVCQFIPVKDGDATPILTKAEDFAASTCPQ